MDWRALVATLSAVSALGLVTSEAACDEQAPRAETEGRTERRPPPDVVRLKNGGLLRGTISELDPGGSVTIVLVSGKTRELPMPEVAYAGPTTEDPKRVDGSEEEVPSEHPAKELESEAPAREVESGVERSSDAETAELVFYSDGEDLTLFRKTGEHEGYGAGVGLIGGQAGSFVARIHTDDLERLCGLPCTLELEPGRYDLGVSKGRRRTVLSKERLDVSSDARVSVRYVDRRGLRIGGLVGGLVGLLGGSILFSVGLSPPRCETIDCDPDVGMMVLGGTIAVFGAGALGLIFVPDKVEFTTSDAEEARLRHPPHRVARMRGLGFSGHF